MHATTQGRGQRGEGWFGFLYVLVTLGLAALFVFYSVPVYMTAYAVNDALHGAAKDQNLRGAGYRRIRDNVGKRLRTSYVDSISADQLKIIKVPTGRKLQIEYSVNKHFLFNVGIHYHFDESAVLPDNGRSDNS